MNPDFVIAGAPKCATTAVFDCLAQHSQVFATTPKEPHYFASSALGQAVMQSDLTHEQYQALFAGKQAGQVSGEGSTHYLHMADKVAARMASEIPAVRLIFCLRDPVARAFSHFQFRYSTAGPFTTGGAGQKRDFAAFIRKPEMFSMGDYASNLAIFFQHFSKEQILLLFYEDIVQDLGGCMRRVCDHIGVETEFAFDLSQRSNQTVYVRYPALMPLADGLIRLFYRFLPVEGKQRMLQLWRDCFFGRGGKKQHLASNQRRAAIELYRPSIMRLQDMTGRDLSAWLAA